MAEKCRLICEASCIQEANNCISTPIRISSKEIDQYLDNRIHDACAWCSIWKIWHIPTLPCECAFHGCKASWCPARVYVFPSTVTISYNAMACVWMSMERNCVLWGNHAIVPALLQKWKLLHEGHPKMKSMPCLAALNGWWHCSNTPHMLYLPEQQHVAEPVALMPFTEKPW